MIIVGDMAIGTTTGTVITGGGILMVHRFIGAGIVGTAQDGV